jgi:Electron transfer DM13
MRIIRRYRWPLIGVGVAALIVGFFAFRPDKFFVDDAVDESLAEAFGPDRDVASGTPQTTQTPLGDQPTDGSETSPGAAGAEPGPKAAEPMALAAGDFVGVDHRAAGTATLYEQNGEFVLRFEDDTTIQNGPDLFVWLLATDSYDGGVPTDYLDLGKIKGNVGGQNYELPPEFDPDVHQLVLVWCKRFAVPFAAAPLT